MSLMKPKMTQKRFKDDPKMLNWFKNITTMPPTNCSKVILKCLNTCPKHFKNVLKYRKMDLKMLPASPYNHL